MPTKPLFASLPTQPYRSRVLPIAVQAEKRSTILVPKVSIEQRGLAVYEALDRGELWAAVLTVK